MHRVATWVFCQAVISTLSAAAVAGGPDGNFHSHGGGGGGKRARRSSPLSRRRQASQAVIATLTAAAASQIWPYSKHFLKNLIWIRLKQPDPQLASIRIRYSSIKCYEYTNVSVCIWLITPFPSNMTHWVRG